LENLNRAERKLKQIEDTLELFLPYIHDWHQIFETRNLHDLSIREDEFRFAPEKLDWRDYWLHVHMPDSGAGVSPPSKVGPGDVETEVPHPVDRPGEAARGAGPRIPPQPEVRTRKAVN